MRCLEDFQQFDFKHQGAERRDGRACATLAICQFLRDSQFPFRTYRHQSQCFNQPGITPLTGNSAGSPRATELSNTVPSISFPV